MKKRAEPIVFVMPAIAYMDVGSRATQDTKAETGIQELVGFTGIDFLDTGVRRCDESFFNSH